MNQAPHQSSHGMVDDDEANAVRELLSRLADGDCDGVVTPQACSHWREHPGARASWHEYHLIGDLLRSQELHRSPHEDADFLLALRQRMVGEPSLVAPLPASLSLRRTQGSRRWIAPVAATAGVAAVVSLVLVLRATEFAPALAPLVAAAPVQQPPDVAMMRDARVDLYLQAHQGMRASVAAAMPGAALRNVDVLVQGR